MTTRTPPIAYRREKLVGALYVHARPFVTFHMHPLVAHAADNAFPSDHLAVCGLAVGFLWNRSRALAVIALAFAVALGAARVLAGPHWPIDIAGGFAEGLLGSALGCVLGPACRGAIREVADSAINK